MSDRFCFSEKLRASAASSRIRLSLKLRELSLACLSVRSLWRLARESGVRNSIPFLDRSRSIKTA
jgi:hypothetical protein